MNLVPSIAGFAGMLALGATLFGADAAAVPLFVLCLVLGLLGLLFPGPEKPGAGRVYSALAILAGASPFIADALRDLRMSQLEAARARETAPLYERLEATRADAAARLAEYRAANGYVPELAAGEATLPFVDRDGSVRNGPPIPGFAVPDDPFAAGSPLRWARAGNAGALLVSAGQDGVVQLPLPGPMLDPAPASDWAPWAATGLDPRLASYDPTNGALSQGDVPLWVGDGAMAEAFAPLHAAWDEVHRAAPPVPPPPPGETQGALRQATEDARAAERFFAEGRDLEALAAASRGLANRGGDPARWGAGEGRLGYLRGMALYHLGNHRAAADALAAHLAVDANDIDAHYHLAMAALLGNDRPTAERHLSIAAQISVDSPVTGIAQAALDTLRRGGAPVVPPSRSSGAR
ncbi:MAG: hypothetical protein SF028_09955 [Candidatus Sumerlaeia bacterium]|nr:hypothetical protein [Candidatus Sumerlaeia bacterium]